MIDLLINSKTTSTAEYETTGYPVEKQNRYIIVLIEKLITTFNTILNLSAIEAEFSYQNILAS